MRDRHGCIASHAYLPPMWLLSAGGVLAWLVVLVLGRPEAVGDRGEG